MRRKFSAEILFRPLIGVLPLLGLSDRMGWKGALWMGAVLTGSLLVGGVLADLFGKRFSDRVHFPVYIALLAVLSGMAGLLWTGIPGEDFALLIFSGVLLYVCPEPKGSLLQTSARYAFFGVSVTGWLLLFDLLPGSMFYPIALLSVAALLALGTYLLCRRNKEEWRGCKACPMAGNCALYESIKDVHEEAAES